MNNNNNNSSINSLGHADTSRQRTVSEQAWYSDQGLFQPMQTYRCIDTIWLEHVTLP